MDFAKKYFLFTFLTVAIALNAGLWYAVYREQPAKLVIAFLNIGQGDAIYIESPTHNQLLVDGGPPHTVMSELGAVMPFYDRSIDMIMVTNPDQDHIGGFIDVLKSYDVKEVIEPGTLTDTLVNKNMEELIALEKAQKIRARRGMIIHLGGGADLHILFPDRDVSDLKTNDGSIITKLVYGKTSVMLTGDAPSATEEYAGSLDPSIMKSDILKAGHHGSRTSASETFVSDVSPEYAVISAGVKNKYGHPHKETLDLFEKLNIPVLGTYEQGRIVFESDGNSLVLKK